MKIIITSLLCFLGTILAFSQASISKHELTTDAAVEFADMITTADLKLHLSKLASNEFEGRETGTEGQKKAANYIAKYFDGLNLPKIGTDQSYFQEIGFISETWNKVNFKVNDTEFKNLWDYYAFPSTNPVKVNQHFDEIIFLGYGIEDENYNDYKNDIGDVNNKAIIIYDGEPTDKEGNFIVSGTKSPSNWSLDWRAKIKLAKEKGVAHVFIIDRNFKENVVNARKIILNRSLEFGKSEMAESNFASNTFITSKLAEQIIGNDLKSFLKSRDKIEKKGKSDALILKGKNIVVEYDKQVRSIVGENVLGYLEGSDPILKDEVVVVSAHYDHLGKRGDDIYYGADDNGSGTSTVLEVCQSFVEAKKSGAGPKRSILFLLVSGEEKGLLGSEYYSEHPIFPIEKTVANVNVDMVGRIDKKHEGNPEYIYVIGADRLSSELHNINEQVNSVYTNLELDYTYNSEDDPNRYYYRSDHYNFAKKGIPAIFYFNGTHEDYHRITDTIDKIQFDKMAKIGKLVFYTTWELANRKERIVVDKK